ncbi:protein phosphatase [Peptococcaceae bacterium SCADC1_2_3]|nr:protein phosphatase [Peptococcaceae bacterium SCADC1_2_3]KFI36712.1 protein phosphatase [Peptococcaceae bacterium SCADC1_2_3]KFI38191.1 protein phosphatase [Peptococcaceae bacterium SCADC1_2_3]HBQ28680.1 Stp1/IreP family PP2C-type Ser/Thr phosphatase [Desulfotomaculum sp.]
MKWSQATETGLVRKQNEDNFCICPDIGLFAIADGMGGHQAGEIASRLATQKLADFIRTYLEFYSDQETLLTKGMQEINHQIYLISQQNKRYQGMGTTLTAALIQNNHLYLAHIGDSRLYLLRQGQIKQLTEDHTVVQNLVANSTITADQARTHPKRHILTRALGIDSSVKAEISKITLRTQDKILLCTDGLTNYVTPEEIHHLVNNAAEVKQAVHNLTEMALERGGADNITVILVAVD